ncbi:MAG: orotidine-5'-phosphate decarboxylase [Alphaproteobacteria bacterium]|nr:orotidine-5'-phosphate decarboxylase [Alphaproteobacteria bacterium]
MTSALFPNPVFVALDTPDLARALAIAEAVKPYVGGLKVGLEFITALGPDAVRRVTQTGLPVFADVKFHDIPNTVAGASRAIAMLGVRIFNVHASGGGGMIRAAADAIADIYPRPLLLAVTVLTSLDDSALTAVGQATPAGEQATRLAGLAKESGADGVVCSAHEIGMVRKAAGADFLTAVPGIRPAGADLADQRRVMTPAAARAAGADILVVGRPITAAADPASAARLIAEELGAARP